MTDVFKKPAFPISGVKSAVPETPINQDKVDTSRDVKGIQEEQVVHSTKKEGSEEKAASSKEKVQDFVHSSKKDCSEQRAMSCAPVPVKPATSLVPIPYSEPCWGGRPDVLYSLEELKSGLSLRYIPLDNRSFYCIGRMENCHITMAHPSISRYHAIIQYRSTLSSSDEKKGFYLYDLGSTHGTYLNKMRLMPKMYQKIQVGHIIKFGNSSRLFILHGPEDDQEEESQLSYTQMKEMRQKQLEERERAYLEAQEKLCQAKDDDGIDWGMGEDADEETDLTENPFAATTNEELYIEDPKKTLKGWFEREGLELTYNVEETGFGQFRCQIEVPVDTAPSGYVTAEANVHGKKKEAVHQCALEACRILDRSGLLRQSTHESKQKKRKNWAEDDYYDSDEDNFFDRTGELEVKRKQRMLQVSKDQPVVDTYETLMEKHKLLLEEIAGLESKLQQITKASARNLDSNDSADSLDSFMTNLIAVEPVDKVEQKKCRVKLTALREQEERLKKLINIAKPYSLPELKPAMECVKNKNEKSKSAHCAQKIFKNSSSKQGRFMSEVSHEGSDTQTNESAADLQADTQINESEPEVHAHNDGAADTVTKNQIDVAAISVTQKKVLKKPKTLISKKEERTSEDYSNLVWTPPANQTGDGRTSLNDKLGY